MRRRSKLKGLTANTLAQEQIDRRTIRAMALNRQGYKSRVEEYLGGALKEFYKAQLAEKNGETKWVVHWRSEVRRLIELSLPATVATEIRGFKDRRKAVGEVVNYIRAHDATYRHIAMNQVLRDFELRRTKKLLDEQDTAAFWAMAEPQIEIGLASV